MHWLLQIPSSNDTREDSTHGHHQMVKTEIRLIIFFAAKDGEALYSQQKQDQELTVAQSHYFMANRSGKVESVTDCIFLGASINADGGL